jgi:outer membrane biosynthesis protein TonB
MKNTLRIIDLLLQHKGILFSSLAHILLFALLLLNFSQCQNKRPTEMIISVDLLPIAKKTNIENKQNKKKSEKETKIIEKQKTTTETKKEIKEKTTEQKKEVIKKEEIVKKDKLKKKEEKTISKPKPKKIVKKKKKPIINEYDALFKTLEDSEEKSDIEEKVDKTSKGQHNPGMKLSLSVKDSIKKQIEQCWSPPAGNKDAGKLQILLDISFNQDGSVSKAKVINNNRYSSDEMYKVAADAAVRAVYKCSPLQDLPIDQYKAWERIEFNFDPSEMIY